MNATQRQLLDRLRRHRAKFHRSTRIGFVARSGPGYGRATAHGLHHCWPVGHPATLEHLANAGYLTRVPDADPPIYVLT